MCVCVKSCVTILSFDNMVTQLLTHTQLDHLDELTMMTCSRCCAVKILSNKCLPRKYCPISVCQENIVQLDPFHCQPIYCHYCLSLYRNLDRVCLGSISFIVSSLLHEVTWRSLILPKMFSFCLTNEFLFAFLLAAENYFCTEFNALNLANI